MNNPLHAAYYADQAVQRTVEVVENVNVAAQTFRLRFRCAEIGALIQPGQFLMLRLANIEDPLLGRPLALYDVVDRELIDVVYLAGGKMTKRFAELQVGQQLVVWGPLGNGFELRPTDQLVMVAGGIGQTPFVALAKQYLGAAGYGRFARERIANRVSLCYGARSSDLFAGLNDFAAAGADIHLATEDGSQGHRGLVTDVLRNILDESVAETQIACCGPEPMMEAVSNIAIERGLPCQVSLETPMACGIGICFSCVAKVADQAGEWDYKRTCVEGPVFEASQIVW